ncbi:MAG: hypothetical protein ACRDZO_05075 [Egibacteraceae bacterium]
MTDVLLRKRFARFFDANQVYEFLAALIAVAGARRGPRRVSGCDG